MPNTSFPLSPSMLGEGSNKLWQRAGKEERRIDRQIERRVAYAALTGKTIKTKVETIKMSDPVTHTSRSIALR